MCSTGPRSPSALNPRRCRMATKNRGPESDGLPKASGLLHPVDQRSSAGQRTPNGERARRYALWSETRSCDRGSSSTPKGRLASTRISNCQGLVYHTRRRNVRRPPGPLVGACRCDDVQRVRHQPWHSIPTRQLDRGEYGRTQRAWRHHTEPALLLLHRPRSRGGRWSDRIAVWCVVHGGVLVRRQTAYGRRSRGVPWRWANRTLKAHTGPAAGQTCHLTNGRRPTVAQSIRTMPVRPDELPPVLAGHHLHRGRATPTDDIGDTPHVPLALPMVPPEQTLAGRYAGHVLTREEHALYLDEWRGWTADHAEYSTTDVAALCMASVRLWRVELVAGRTTDGRSCRLLHCAYLHLQRLRASLGATRRHRLAV